MPALSNVALTDTFDVWRVRTNQVIVKGNQEEIKVTDAYDKANSANLLAYNTGIGTNTYILATIAGANSAVGNGANAYSNLITTGANTHLKSIIMGANTAVGIGANSFAIATISGANTYLLETIAGANAYLLATIAGANSVVGTGANAFTSATVAGANTISIAAFNQANTAQSTANIAAGSAQGAFDKANTVITNAGGIFVGNSTSNVALSNGSLSISGSFVSPFQSFRNKIINGNFDIWQRGTSTSTSNAYCADRFFTDVTGCTFTTSRQSFTLGQTDVPNEPTYYHRTVVTSVAGASNYCLIGQPIESVRTLANNTVTVSFWAKADASKNIAMEFLQNFGTGGSPSANVNTIGVTTCALTTTWTKFIIPVAIPSISGKTIGTNNNDYLAVYFWLNAGSTFNARTNSLGQASGTYEFSQLQIEKGTVATPFEMRPMAIELPLCQRYYIKTSLTFAYNAGTYVSLTFPVTMRATPSMTQTTTADTGISIGPEGFYIINSTTTNFGWTASAEL
jgi:hypothetical protein